MTEPKKFKNESQDARRRDQHNTTHPDEDRGHSKDKEKLEKEKHMDKRK